MCYFIVLLSSLLFYNVENSTNKEKPLNEKVCPNFWLVLYIWIGSIDTDPGQKPVPAGGQASVGDKVSLPAGQENKTEGRPVRYHIGSLTFMCLTFRNKRVSLVKQVFLMTWCELCMKHIIFLQYSSIRFLGGQIHFEKTMCFKFS